MRRLILVLLLLAVPAILMAQHSPPTDAAHGSEKAAAEAAHPGAEHGGEHEAPKFLGVPAWIFKLVNMLLFIGFLGYVIGKTVMSMIAERTTSIQRAAQEARERREKADRVASDIQARLAQLEDELRNIRDRAEQEGERQKRELFAAADAEATRILQNARAEVDSRLKNAKSELTEYAGQLASERAEQLLRERITPQDQAKLFKDSLEQVGEVRS
jgi:F-type H+-transporting ATPase subunit b